MPAYKDNICLDEYRRLISRNIIRYISILKDMIPTDSQVLTEVNHINFILKVFKVLFEFLRLPYGRSEAYCLLHH